MRGQKSKELYAVLLSTFKQYKPLEIVYLGLIALSQLCAFGIYLFNEVYMHYFLSMKAINILFCLYFLIVFHLACVLRNQLSKWGDFAASFSLLAIFVFNSFTIFRIPLFSPFPEITQLLANFNQFLHIDQPTWILWAKSHYFVWKSLTIVYWSLIFFMVSLVAYLLLIVRDNKEFLLFITANIVASIIGIAIAFFWPSLPLISIWKHVVSHPEDLLIIRGYFDVHHYIPFNFSVETIEFPSFHVLWTTLCLFALRHYPLLFRLAFVYLLLIVASTVLLGWHFVMDGLSGFLIAFFSYKIVVLWEKRLARRYPARSRYL